MWDAVNGGLQPQSWHHNIIQARPHPIFPKILALDEKKLITRGLKIYINTQLLSYSINCAKLLSLQDVKEVPSEAPIKLLTRPDSYTLGTKSADLLELEDAVLAKEECMVSDSKQCWSETEERIVDLVINSWRCSKQVGQLIRFTGDHLKLICASAMVMLTVMTCNGVRGLLWKYWKRRKAMWLWKSNGIENAWERGTVKHHGISWWGQSGIQVNTSKEHGGKTWIIWSTRQKIYK